MKQADELPNQLPDQQKNLNDGTTPTRSGLSHIAALLRQHQGNGARAIPPVDQWNPQFCGTMNLTVKSNGEWWHEGSKINRDAMIKLFASVLWCESGNYFLKTPVEKIQIEVEDAPLLVTHIEEVSNDGKVYLTCVTQTGDVIVIDEQHPVFLRDYQGELRPYINVRWDLDALIHRNAFYHLLDSGEFVEQNGSTVVKLTSGDFEFNLGEHELGK